MSFDRKSIGRMSFSQHIRVMSELILLPSVEGMGAKLAEGIGAFDFQPRYLTK